MAGAALTAILDYLVRSRDTLQAAIDDPTFVAVIQDIVEVTAIAIGNGRKLLLAGNGGSAADAQHLAGEMLSRLNYDRAPAAALALTTDSSVLTAIGNDYGYDRLFERQILGLGSPGDVFIAISTSGRSPNILRAIDAAYSTIRWAANPASSKTRVTPWRASSNSRTSRKGSPSTSSNGFGVSAVNAPSRLPRPPHKTTACRTIRGPLA